MCYAVLNQLNVTESWEQIDLRKAANISEFRLFVMNFVRFFYLITCSTVVLQCDRRQAAPMEQAKIRPSVTLYSLDQSLPNLVWLIMSVTPTHTPILVKFGSVGNSPQIGEI